MIQHPYSLAVFENKLYWSDWESKTIQSCDKFSGKNWQILIRASDTPYGVHIDHSAIKPKVSRRIICFLAAKRGREVSLNVLDLISDSTEPMSLESVLAAMRA